MALDEGVEKRYLILARMAEIMMMDDSGRHQTNLISYNNLIFYIKAVEILRRLGNYTRKLPKLLWRKCVENWQIGENSMICNELWDAIKIDFPFISRI